MFAGVSDKKGGEESSQECVMSAALIRADMFSNSPQERRRKEKPRSDISSRSGKMAPAAGKLQRSLEQRKYDGFL